MGNCVFRGFGGVEDLIKVVTSNGGIMELCAPITAESITNEFPGHGLFRSRDLFTQPLLHNEELHVGHLYYLLPLINTSSSRANYKIDRPTGRDGEEGNSSNINISNGTSSSIVDVTPYRMSLDNQGILKRSDIAEVFPRYNSTGVWKVKLVISPHQLSEILSQDARTEALIESVRTVAKCGNGVSSSSSSVANSDQWSLSSSWKASSDSHY